MDWMSFGKKDFGKELSSKDNNFKVDCFIENLDSSSTEIEGVSDVDRSFNPANDMDSSDWNVESLFSLSARVDCFGEVFCVAEGIEAIISFDDVVDNSEAVSVAVSNNASDMVGKNVTWPVRKVSNGRGIGKEAADANIHDDIFCAVLTNLQTCLTRLLIRIFPG